MDYQVYCIILFGVVTLCSAGIFEPRELAEMEGRTGYASQAIQESQGIQESQTGDCSYNGKIYHAGHKIKIDCYFCECTRDGSFVCPEVVCHLPCKHKGKEIPHGGTYKFECNTCTCVNGKGQCTREACKPHSGQCPATVKCGSAATTCKNDFSCQKTEKCCDNNCKSKSCVAAVTPAPRPGSCPAPRESGRVPVVSAACKDACHYDNQCPKSQKCCVNECGGLTCVSPTPVNCGRLTLVEDGGITTDPIHPVTTAGSTVKIMCNEPGFKPSVDAVTCNKDGKWSDNLIGCIERGNTQNSEGGNTPITAGEKGTIYGKGKAKITGGAKNTKGSNTPTVEGMTESADRHVTNGGETTITGGGKTPITKGVETTATKGSKTANIAEEKGTKYGGGKAAVTKGTETTEGGNTPITKGGEISITEGGNTPITKGGKTLITKGGKITITKGVKAPTTKGGKTPVSKGGKAPITEGSNTLITKGGKTTNTEGGAHKNYEM